MPAYTAHTARIIHGEEEKDAIIILWENYPKKKEGKGKALGGKNRKEEKTKTFFPFFLLPPSPFLLQAKLIVNFSSAEKRGDGRGGRERGGRRGYEKYKKREREGRAN